MNNTNQEVLQIALTDIIPNQFQPRVNFDEQELLELSESIKQHGIIQPLVLRKMGAKYEIIAGERRYRAAGMAGLTTVPAIISNIDDQTSAEVALVENVQRKDLTAIEEARSYKNILDKGYLTQEQLAKKMGVSQPAIANKLRLLNLDESVQQALLNGQISERHARSLLAVNNKEKQKEWLAKIINERLTVRQLDVEIKKDQMNTNDGIPLVTITQDVDNIRDNATDIAPVNDPVNNTFFNFDNQAPRPEPPKPTTETAPGDKPQNKFFNFLEDESANMNTLTGDTAIFNSSPTAMPNTMPNNINQTPPISNQPINNQPIQNPIPNGQVQEENKFFNVAPQPAPTPVPTPNSDKPVIDLTPAPSANEPKLETLFDPMDQVDLLDPNYEEKQKEAAGLDLKSAINEARDVIDILKEKGFNVDSEEVDLDNEYQIIIKINKDTTVN